jgi:UDP-glucose-4-epimerase GalE
MQLLITGGAGYIGSVVCEMLLAAGHKPVVIDDLRDGKAAAIPLGIPFFQADFADTDALDTIFSSQRIEAVIHLAASANVPDSVINPLYYYENNVNGTVILLRKMIQYGVKKIIFSSTAAVYGEPKFIPMTEEHPLEPVNPYGFSKLFDEQVIRDCAAAYGLRYFIFRYFCAAGATANHGESRLHESHLVPLCIDAALKNRNSVTVFGNDFDTRDGSGVRDYIHVTDIARAHLLALQAGDDRWNNTLNLGTGDGYSVWEVIRKTEEVTCKTITHALSGRRPGDPASLIASAARAKELVGWEPQYSLEDIIGSALAWRQHPLY